MRAADFLVSTVVVLFLVVAGAYSAYALWDNSQVYAAADNVQAELLQFKPKAGADNGASFEELLGINPDVCAWVTLDNTAIDYPVVQGEDNFTYVNTDVYGDFSLAGSIFLDVNCDKNFTDRKLQARMEQLEESIGRYLEELERADREPTAVSEGRVARLMERIVGLQEQMHQLKEIGVEMQAAPDGQVSLTDPDARSMATSGRGTGVVGYNVQVAVDAEHHLLVAHEVTNLGHDRTQLAPMSQATQEVLGGGRLTVLADRGYFNGEQIKSCEDQGIETLVPKPLTSSNRAAGLYDKQDFIYDAEKNEYRCPAGERAIWRFSTTERGQTISKYWSSACTKCALKSQCTTSVYRRIARWEHEHILDRMSERLKRTPEASRIRRRTVEHVFGTLKAWMGSTHFLTKTLPRVSTEMSLHVLAYNLKRMLTIFGVQPLMRAMAG